MVPFALASTLGWQPGNPATVILAISTVVGWMLSAAVLASRQTSIGSRVSGLLPLNRLLVHATIFGLVALVFWLWALEKIYHSGDRDLGAVTFALAIFANVEAFGLTHPSRPLAELRTVRCHRCLCVSTALGVSANYLFVLLKTIDDETMSWSFRRYLVIGGIFWLFAAVRSTCVVRDDFSMPRDGSSELARITDGYDSAAQGTSDEEMDWGHGVGRHIGRPRH